MKATDNYQFPYPECDPPLIKDASQIVQMTQLALAIDAEVQRIDDMAEDLLTTPAAARVITLATVATTDVQVTPFFNSQVFANSNWPSALPGDGNLRVPEDGWYMVGAHAATDSAVAMQVSIRLTRNGLPASSWSNPGAVYSSGIFQLPALGTVPMQLAALDRMNVEIRHNAAGGTAWNYRPHLWAWKLVTT